MKRSHFIAIAVSHGFLCLCLAVSLRWNLQQARDCAESVNTAYAQGGQRAFEIMTREFDLYDLVPRNPRSEKQDSNITGRTVLEDL